MNCKKVSDLMSDYVDEILPEKIRADFELHIKECDECRDGLRVMNDMLADLNSLGGQQIPVNCWASVRERIIERKTRKPLWYSWILKPAIAAPVFALCLLLTIFLAWPDNIKDPQVTNLVSDAEYSRYIGAHSNLQSQQAFSDPDVIFISAELERASLVGE